MKIKNKRVCFLSARSGFLINGMLFMDQANGRLINELIARGRVSSVACFADLRQKKQYDLPITHSNFYPLPFPHSYAGGVKNFFKIRKTLEEIQKDHDVLIVQLPFVAFRALKSLRIPVVYHVCANVLSAASNRKKYSGWRSVIAVAFSKHIHHFQYKLFKRENTRVIVHGRELARLYKEVKPNAVVSTSIVSGEIITQDELLWNSKGPVTNFIFIGRPSLQKGFDILIEALLMLASAGQQFQLTVIGFDEAYFRTALKELYLKSEPIRSHIVFKGYMNWGEEMRSVIRENHILIVPSRGGEGTPRVILECMSQGVTAIASNIDGIPDIIQEGENGLLFYPLEPSGLLEKMNVLIHNDLLLQQLRINGLEKSKIMTVKEFADHFINALDELVGYED